MPARHDPPLSARPLTPVVFEILIALGSQDRHGYSILVDIAERTGAPMRPGSLYRALNRMLDEGLVEEIASPVEPDTDDERRRYYRLTSRGRRAAALETARLEAQLRAARAAALDDRQS